MKAGIGFDVHRFDQSRPLVLGGVEIPDAPGLAGHSDADVLSHSIADALLGAAGLGDLGTHFPDDDPAWKNASSLGILGRTATMLAELGYAVLSVDATLLLEAPRIGARRNEMSRNIAHALGISSELVSVKASTTEGLGTVGRGEGAACLSVVLVDRNTVNS